MKKLISLLILLIAFCYKAQTVKTSQDLYSTFSPPIDPVIGMTSNGVSESVASADKQLNNPPSYDFGGESLSKSLKKVSELKVAKIKTKSKSNSSTSNNKSNKVDPFSFSEDNEPSFVGKKINVNDHYKKQKDGSYVKKATVKKTKK